MADYTISSGNIFKDLGFPNPDEELAKGQTGIKDQSPNCRSREMTQKEAVRVFWELADQK